MVKVYRIKIFSFAFKKKKKRARIRSTTSHREIRPCHEKRPSSFVEWLVMMASFNDVGSVPDASGNRSMENHATCNNIAIFQRYLIQKLLHHNPWWLKDAPEWCRDKRIPNETMAVKAAEFSKSIQEFMQAPDTVDCPMDISVSETFGRHLVATRDILPGELLLIEPPVVLTVRPRSPPYCTLCFKRAEQFTCPSCGFFLCGPECMTDEHKDECLLLQRFGFAEAEREKLQDERLLWDRLSAMPPEQQEQARVLLKQAQESSLLQRRFNILQQYTVVPLIKTLVMMNRSELLRDVTLTLQGNCTENSQRYRINQRSIVDVALNKLQVPIDKSLGHQICSIWDTNGFEVPLIWGTRVHGLYPFASLLTHNCRSNTQQWFTNYGGLALRAVDHIRMGEILTTCYTDPQWATMLRQDHLRVSKQFTCTCRRCKDRTEFGTFLGSPLCSSCPGLMVSSDPTDPKAHWFCNKGCSQTATAGEVASVGSSIATDLKGLDPTDIRAIDGLADRLQKKVHPTHHVLFQLHVSNLRNLASRDVSELSEEELVHLSNMAAIVMDVVRRIEAPFARLRIRMAREDIRLRLESLKRYRKCNPKIKEQLQALASQVQDCDFVLGWDERVPNFKPVVQEYQNLLNDAL
ncbi:SET domain-containing protein SmydA-8-like isoform X2 [Macrobrachium nipponense]|uniref:SET domain-containing protein SmydA-8-like isoform X2 n=1 Tax=Macrobrachium nipponense TaxID=159736 RepID=UPI0030C893CD